MGVRGLTTFIATRSSQYLESYELSDCYVVIDGDSIACQLYKWHCKCNDCFGGDYDKYANVVTNFYQMLSDCGVTPLVVLDGAYEKRKMATVYHRMRNKICSAKRLNSVTEGSVPMFPLFIREVFVDVTLKMKVKCMRCDFEGDSNAAYLAKSLKCPLLSYDSDFYIFDVLYVPFSTVDLRVRRRKNIKYIACEVYNVDKFLDSFGGLDKINLPLLAVLLGNDYIKRSAFSRFYRQLKMQKSQQNEQQRIIKSVIMWLKNETPESALRKILGRFKLRNRQRLANIIETAIKGYQCLDSMVCSYFNVSLMDENETCIIVPKAEEIEDEITEDEEVSDNSEESEEECEDDKSTVPYTSNFFQENYRNCVYPSCFMDMMVSRTYYCIPQIEDFSLEHSHTISLDILATIHKILTNSETQQLICVARNEHSAIKKLSLPLCDKKVFKLSEIQHLNLSTRKQFLLDILNIENDNIFHLFPNSWHLFLISLKYWVSNSKSKVEMPYIFSLILCGIILNYVDTKIGFYRSTKSFFAKYGTNRTETKQTLKYEQNIMRSLSEIDLDDSISCMRKLIHYFQMDAKMKTNIRLFDRTIVHQFSEFQSCLLHIKYLNSLLNFPFGPIVISEFYDGTFLYNMTTNLLKRTDLKNYMRILFADCPKILNTFELMTESIETHIGSDLMQKVLPKRRKKKKKCKEACLVDDSYTVKESDDEIVLDTNNKYSLLHFVTK